MVTGVGDFATDTDKTLLGFELNPLHNLVHLLIGLAGLALWRRLDTARTYGWLLLATGWSSSSICFAVGNPNLNFLSLNARDNRRARQRTDEMQHVSPAGRSGRPGGPHGSAHP